MAKKWPVSLDFDSVPNDQPPSPGCTPDPMGWFCPTPKRRIKTAKARRAKPKRRPFDPRRE